MAHMPDLEGDARRAVGWLEDHIPHHAAPAPMFTPSPQPEAPSMSSALLADAEKAARALTSHIATLLGNPLVDAIVEAGLGLVLTPGEVTAVTAFIREIEAERSAVAGAQPVQPPEPANGTGTQAAQPQVM